ncbi:hypothetical protein NPIL_486961 [Nephila pilipes]|uniref:Uncharacterized protein n=1 Tax=Nephila pilipes TaxID=299642 RepID=A0A8X6PCM2_NEPPI|nr:hypothetical protein NPIL_486941 [Nephila pilipes]GFT59552.1 hypothetical protein NPIL_486961 [Nephila pilipes]
MWLLDKCFITYPQWNPPTTFSSSATLSLPSHMNKLHDHLHVHHDTSYSSMASVTTSMPCDHLFLHLTASSDFLPLTHHVHNDLSAIIHGHQNTPQVLKLTSSMTPSMATVVPPGPP